MPLPFGDKKYEFEFYHFSAKMTKILFKPVDVIRETYERSHYKDLNKARPVASILTSDTNHIYP